MSLCELGCLLQSSRTLSRDIHQWQLCALLKTAYISSFPITDKFLCPCLMTLEPDIKCLEQWFSTLAASHLELLRIPISRPHPWPVKSASLWGRPGHQGCESSPGDSNMQPRLRIADLKGQSPRESKQKKTSFYTPKKGRLYKWRARLFSRPGLFPRWKTLLWATRPHHHALMKFPPGLFHNAVNRSSVQGLLIAQQL